MEKFTLNLDANNYVLSIAHTPSDSVELDLSKYDLNHLSCYRFINGGLVLDEAKISRLKAEEEKAKLIEEKAELEAWLKAHDYIGTKIATGRATIEEYAIEIAEMTEKADRINEIEVEIAALTKAEE